MKVRQAIITDADRIYELIKIRMRWMDENNIYQWNKTKYLERYPLSYIKDQIENNTFYVAYNSCNIFGAMALFTNDQRWQDTSESIYVHHLVADPSEKGTGALLIKFAEKYAKKNGFYSVRLDSQENNICLDKYYDALGYIKCGMCKDGLYIGYLREKIV